MRGEGGGENKVGRGGENKKIIINLVSAKFLPRESQMLNCIAVIISELLYEFSSAGAMRAV